MNKKHILLFIFCLLTAVFLPFNSLAADKVNTTEKCSFSFTFIAGEEKASDVEFRIYRVADIYSSNEYSVTKKFASYPVSYNDMYNADSWRNLAQTLLGYIVSDNLQADATSKTNADGIAYFKELPVGLYLVMGSQYITEKRIYTPQSFMISAPATDVNGNFQYDLEADIKYDSNTYDENSELKILKIWNDSSNPNRPKEIIVELYSDGSLYGEIVLNKANNWKYKFENLSRNSVWTVREKTVENGYTVSVERQEKGFVFTNTYTVNTPPDTSDDRLPQTGLLWWPVPCLLAGGLLIMIIGILCRRGAADEK